MNLFGERKTYYGPIGLEAGNEDVTPFQAGVNRVTTNGQLGIAYIDAGEVTDMFTLDPGTHRVKYPGNGVVVVVECDPATEWFVKFGGVFNPSDPTRITAALVRPKSPQEEMQSYMNELAARALGRKNMDMLRSGQAEFDPSQDDYSEEHEDDSIAPLSIGQLSIIMEELQRDIVAKRQADNAPISPLKTPSNGGNEQPKPADPPPTD